ncbi:hypothetical protein BDZ91DRAFT_849511 [Kalaharituber pfeilii]|nr:hypothetical protein BDZ91DRAFT_849511 [Kalaharituber pfeilii]
MAPAPSFALSALSLPSIPICAFTHRSLILCLLSAISSLTRIRSAVFALPVLPALLTALIAAVESVSSSTFALLSGRQSSQDRRTTPLPERVDHGGRDAHGGESPTSGGKKQSGNKLQASAAVKRIDSHLSRTAEGQRSQSIKTQSRQSGKPGVPMVYRRGRIGSTHLG